MTTLIIDNGSKWHGEEPDGIEKLFDMLKNHPLDRSFENFGNFYDPTPHFCDQWGNHTHPEEYKGLAGFWGNFFGWSHVFRIYTDDLQLIKNLLEAITENQNRPDYLSQEKPVSTDHPYDKDCDCLECAYTRHSETCEICNQ